VCHMIPFASFFIVIARWYTIFAMIFHLFFHRGGGLDRVSFLASCDLLVPSNVSMKE
jgi:hypothetical protein